jgi:hypothetical protein
MMIRRVASVLLAVLVVFSACSSDADVGEEETPEPKGPCQTSPPSDLEEDSGASDDIRRPATGDYVYEFCGLGGTDVPSGTKLKENLAREGDLDSIEVSTNINRNLRRIVLRWEEGRVLQLINGTIIAGRGRRCTYDPPLEILHIPIRVESFAQQDTDPSLCRGRVDVSVLGRQSVRDGEGRRWTTWVIEVNSEAPSQTEQERHWFAPDLGRDVRVETTTEKADVVNQTAQLLLSYPGSS